MSVGTPGESGDPHHEKESLGYPSDQVVEDGSQLKSQSSRKPVNVKTHSIGDRSGKTGQSS